MIEIRPSEERGHNKLSWLDSRFTFSFDQYYDPDHMQFRSLRVINEDVVAPGGGFPTHPHRDMEILTWILDGALEHRDNTGGRGVLHSEFNPSPKDPVHLLQIWLLPERRGLDPAYEQLSFADGELRNKFSLVAGPQAPVTIRQNANLYIARLDKGATAEHSLEPDRGAWVQVARGKVKLNGAELKAGDGAAISNETNVKVEAQEPSEVLLFDLA